MDKDTSIKYFNDLAATWDEQPRGNQFEKLVFLANRLEIAPNSTVLDVGTGTGVFLPYIAQQLNGAGSIICLDFAINMLQITRSKASQTTVKYICGEVENSPLKNSSFDTVVCFSTFPHFHDKQNALRNIHRVLKKNGILYIFHGASRENINRIHRSVPDLQDDLIPSLQEMHKLLDNEGYSAIKIDEGVDYYFAQATCL